MSLVSGIMGAGATKSAANTAADAQMNSTAMGVASSKEMFDLAAEALRPYMEAGYRGLTEYEGAPSGAEAPAFPSADIPFEFDPNDPLYLIQKEEQEKAINAQAAMRGGFGSTPTMERLSDADRNLRANELGNQYGRAVDQYGREYQGAVDKFNIDNALVQQNLNKWFALANVGRGTAGAQGSLGAQAGGQISSAYQSQGNQLANIYSNEGNQLSSIYGNIAPNAIGSAYYGAKAYQGYQANQAATSAQNYAKAYYGGQASAGNLGQGTAFGAGRY